MTTDDDALTKTRLDVAEMKGMLTQALSDQGSRIKALEGGNDLIHGRLSDRAKENATHAEKISGLEKAVNVLENDNRARRASIIGIGGVIISAAALALAVINRITL